MNKNFRSLCNSMKFETILCGKKDIKHKKVGKPSRRGFNVLGWFLSIVIVGIIGLYISCIVLIRRM